MKKSSYTSPRANTHRLQRQQSSHSSKVYFDDNDDLDYHSDQRGLIRRYPMQQNYFRRSDNELLSYDPYESVRISLDYLDIYIINF